MTIFGHSISRREAGVLAIILIGIGLVAVRPLAMLAINQSLSRSIGVRIISSESIWIDPIALLSGRIEMTARRIVFSQNLLNKNMAVDTLSVQYTSSETQAKFGFGAYRGNARYRHSDGAPRLESLISGGSGSYLKVNMFQDVGQPMTLLAKAQHSAPLFAALLEQPPKDNSQYPDTVNVQMTHGDGGMARLRYELLARNFTVTGNGLWDPARKALTHDGDLRIKAYADKNTPEENRYEALRGRLSLFADTAQWLADKKVNAGLRLTLPGQDIGYSLLLANNPAVRGREPPRLVIRELGMASNAELVDVRFLPTRDDERLHARGALGLWANPRPLELILSGSTGDPVSGFVLNLDGGPSHSGMRVAGEFTKGFLSRNTGMELAVDGRLGPASFSPAFQRHFNSLASAWSALGVDRNGLRINGKAHFKSESVEIDDLKLAAGPMALALNGKLQGGAGDIEVDGHVSTTTPEALARLWKAADAMGAKPGQGHAAHQNGPGISANVTLDRLNVSQLSFERVVLSYKSGQNADVKFAGISFGKRRLVNDGALSLPIMVRAQQPISATGKTRYGPVSLSFHPRQGGTLADAWSKGGMIAGKFPGVRVSGALSPTGADNLRLSVVTDALNNIAALRDVLGANSQFLPMEPMTGVINLTRNYRLIDATLKSKSLGMSVQPGEAGQMKFAIDGAAAAVLHNVPHGRGLFQPNAPLHISGAVARSGRQTTISDLMIRLADVTADGVTHMNDDGVIDAQLTVRAQRAEAIARLFPNVLAVIPANMMNEPVKVPVRLTGSQGNLNVSAQDALIGGIHMTSTFATARDGALSGRIRIDGPIAQSMMAGAPAWLSDVLGPRQTLSGFVTISTGRLLRITELKLDGNHIGMRGEVFVPLRNGNFNFPGTEGQISGTLNQATYDKMVFPNVRFRADLKSLTKSLHANFDLQGGGTGAADLIIDSTGAATSSARATLKLFNVDVGALSRNTGGRLFGAGILNADLEASIPSQLFQTTATTEALGDTLLRLGTGRGKIDIVNGTLLDVSFTEQARNGSGGTGRGLSTAFRNMQGGLALGNGLLEIADGKFVSQDFNLDIGGTVKMPDVLLNLTLKGKIALVSGAESGRALISMGFPPLHVTGSATKPSYNFGKGTGGLVNAAIGVVKTVDKVGKAIDRVDDSISSTVNRKLFDKILPKKAREPVPEGPLPAGVE